MPDIPSPLDEVARITVRLYGSGQMGIEGNVGDKQLAIKMLEQAIEAVRHQHQHAKPKEAELIVPGRDVSARPDAAFPVNYLGDLKPHERGDLTVRQR